MIQMKPIKPAPFKSEAIYRRMAGAARRTVELTEKEFAKTYRTWDHKPKFERSIKETIAGTYWAVWTIDQVYAWLNDGTRKNYKIPKAKPGLLVFSSGYKAKTSPGVVHSTTGGPFGEKVFFFGQVTHPGIDRRDFDLAVSKFVNPWWVRWMDEAIKYGAKESGHAI